MSNVAALCAPELAGRRAGTEGERQAAEWLVGQLELAGVGALPPNDRRSHELAIPAPKQRQGEQRPGSAPKGGWVSRNVLGFIPGSNDDPAGEVIVLGAHYDHLGVREGNLYPGADDNASGVAVVLQVAKALVRRRAELRRSVVVVFFGAEEIGLGGSKAFVRDRVVDPRRIAVMVNVDMVGRKLADRTGLGLPIRVLGIDATRSVAVLGTEARPALRDIVRRSCFEAGIEAVLPEDLPGIVASVVQAAARGRADSASFEAAGVPTLFFSSGESDDYHEPTDVPHRLVGPLMARRAQAVLRSVLALSNQTAPPGK